MWDYICVTNAIRPRKPRILVWAPNISGEMGGMIRSVGGIPIPENDLRATGAYLRSLYDYLESGGWLHIYPEGSMWEYYAPIRPFKVGAASIAVHTDKPIVQMGFSYRKPGWFRRVILRQIATYTLTIGEPLYADPTLSVHEQELDLTKRMHDAVCALAGIDPKENIYPPIFEDSKRIDYYTDQYGIGYKGSW
jgi:1-acyl-sn-glycerol-3-phosphate acyltransferase